jgi:hypothetical protein
MPDSAPATVAGIKAVVENPNTESALQDLLGLGIAFAEGGTKKAKFDYPGGYSIIANNEFGQKMKVTFNGEADIDVEPAPTEPSGATTS